MHARMRITSRPLQNHGVRVQRGHQRRLGWGSDQHTLPEQGVTLRVLQTPAGYRIVDDGRFTACFSPKQIVKPAAIKSENKRGRATTYRSFSCVFAFLQGCKFVIRYEPTSSTSSFSSALSRLDDWSPKLFLQLRSLSFTFHR